MRAAEARVFSTYREGNRLTGSLTPAALARALGVTRQAVAKAVASGRIRPDAAGLFDLATARRQWLANTDPSRSPVPEVGSIRLGAVDATGDGPDVALRPDEIRRRLKAGDALTFAEARTANEISKARQADIKLDELEGQLVPVADVQALWEAQNIALRDRFRAIPMAVTERVIDAVKQGSAAPVVARLLLAEIDAALEDAAAAELIVDADA
jgi:hypothetical protein